MTKRNIHSFDEIPKRWALKVILLVCLSYFFVIPGFLNAQEKGNLLSLSLTGRVPDNVPPERNISFIMSLERVQKLFLDMAESPQEADTISESLEGLSITLDDLLSLSLIKQQDSLYVIGFSLFTVEDQARLREICDEFAKSLSEEFLKKRDQFEMILSRYPLKNISVQSLAYILVGCFSLDWDGLNISAEMGYRTVDFSGEEPKVMQAIESGSWQGSSVKGIYWGSHNEDLRNGIVFTTFGDHHTQPRMGLPDLAWQTGRKLREIEAVDNLKPVLLRTLHTILYQGLMEETGKIMMILRDGKRTGLEISHFVELEPERIQLLLELLEVLQYIRKEKEYYETVIPVFSPDDREMVRDILKIGRKVIVDWFEQNFERLRSCLSVLSAYHYGQSLELTFYKVWHEIFGAANRMLCEKGMFIDPYNSGRKYPGFIPVVWHVDVDAGMKKIK